MVRSSYWRLFVCCAVGICCAASSAIANPFINLNILGSTSQGGTYTNNLSNLHIGDTVYIEVAGQMAGVGTTNGSKTITSLDPTKDGVSSLKFDLASTDTPNWLSTSFNLAKPSSPAPYAANVDWTSGSGFSAGILSGTTVGGIRPTINGADGATIPSSSDVIWYGQMTIGSANSTISGNWSSGGSGGYKINGGSGQFITSSETTATDHLVGFAPLTLSLVSVPEPTVIGWLVGAAALALFRRARRRRACPTY